ncbi:MucR family transcriptional regulator [Desulfurivibrio alkaliphilus]|uniref:Transcriptional regulator, MucR family n=1 Tax=Desulfurivibrio alkaliphilus (strain DSM 19089 / UNIQEM U267 / AHT2) TaxID=589865 RepID=D6Z6M7_DESAT|nr:MucR family transcriptional regulator [Desulfurivibrio alkaliphilus]ADH84986.1 transcriptional regulator, MucR family [Desulfurivibrio alkaliphilus AHT 2]
MAKSLVEMAAELVQAQCSSTSLTAEEMAQSLQATYNVLHNLQQDESRGVAADVGLAKPALTGSPEKSIQKHKIVCLECGEEFKTLSSKHLQTHGLTGREYRQKWGLSLRQPLCARELTDRRKKLGKARGLPDNLRKSIAARSGKTTTKASAGTKKATAGAGKKTTTRKSKPSAAAKSAATKS